MVTAEEQVLAKALAAYRARITGAEATVDGNVGTPTVELSIEDNTTDTKKLVFDFKNLRGNGISSVVFVEEGENKGRVTFNMLDGTSETFDGIADAISYLMSVCIVSDFEDANNDGNVVASGI